MSAELVPVGQPAAVAVWSEEQAELLRQQMCPGATAVELSYFAQLAERKGLDPFAGEIIAQMRWSEKAKRKVIVVQETVAGLRTIAERTGLYGGQSAPEWCGPDGVWKDVWLEEGPPAAAKVRVYRKDWPEPATGIATYSSYVQLGSNGQPVAQWASGPDYMLWKCAEAAALKRAFRRQLEDVGVNTREFTPPERVSMEARIAGLDDDDRHALVAEITAGRTDSTRDADDTEILKLRAEIARLQAAQAAPALRSVTSVGPGGSETAWYDTTTGERVDPPAAGATPTAVGGSAVDAPGPDPETATTPVDGPPPPSTDTAASGPDPDEPPGYVDPDGRVHVPQVRPDVARLRERFKALPPDEKTAVFAWLAKAKIPDTFDVSEAKVKAVNAELDRRAKQ